MKHCLRTRAKIRCFVPTFLLPLELLAVASKRANVVRLSAKSCAEDVLCGRPQHAAEGRQREGEGEVQKRLAIIRIVGRVGCDLQGPVCEAAQHPLGSSLYAQVHSFTSQHEEAVGDHGGEEPRWHHLTVKQVMVRQRLEHLHICIYIRLPKSRTAESVQSAGKMCHMQRSEVAIGAPSLGRWNRRSLCKTSASIGAQGL
mmetsp:Transcript_107165/g.255837  ORF Transcript_107165/g.255837 Transcript_107165/m.255837 type:complete len:200 (-) Transcript_107165:78-677(-)